MAVCEKYVRLDSKLVFYVGKIGGLSSNAYPLIPSHKQRIKNKMELTGNNLIKRLKSARSLLTYASIKNFGKGKIDLEHKRFIADNGQWCLQYIYDNGISGSEGQVTIKML